MTITFGLDLCSLGLGISSGAVTPTIVPFFLNDYTQPISTAFDDDAVQLIGPPTTITRNSNAMGWSENQLLQFLPHQRVINSAWGERTGDVPSQWGSGNLNTVSYTDLTDENGEAYSRAVFSGTSQGSFLNLINVPVQGSKRYTAALYIDDSSITSGDDQLLIIFSTGGPGNVTINQSDFTTAGWYLVGFEVGSASTSVQLRAGLGTALGTPTGSVTMSRVTVVEGWTGGVTQNSVVRQDGPPLGRWVRTTSTSATAFNAPCFDHDPTTGAAKGLWVQGQRENFFIRSTDLTDAAWNQDDLTVTADQETSPDGNLSGAEISINNTNTHGMNQNYTFAANTVLSITWYFKAGTQDYAVICLNRNSQQYATAVFDISSGSTETSATETVTGSSSGTIVETKQRSVGNGWFECTLIASVNNTQQSAYLQVATAATGNSFNSFGLTSANAGDTIFAWEPRLEDADFPSIHPIPTAASTATRLADDVGGSFVGPADEGSYAVEASIPYAATPDRTLVVTDNGSSVNQARLFMNAEKINMETINPGGTNGLSAHPDVLALNTSFNAVGSYEDKSVKTRVNNVDGPEDTSADLPLQNLNTNIKIGRDADGNYYFGHIESAAGFDVPLLLFLLRYGFPLIKV